MLNEFIIKSSLSELKNLGYDIAECVSLYDEEDCLEGCVFKINYKGNYLYSLCYYSMNSEFSFDKHVLKPIEHIVYDYSRSPVSHNEFVWFIQGQCFAKSYFEHGRIVSFYTTKSNDLFGKFAIEYTNQKHFINDLENIDLSSLIYFA